jgi:uncharacterized protein (TIGR02117 family)
MGYQTLAATRRASVRRNAEFPDLPGGLARSWHLADIQAMLRRLLSIALIAPGLIGLYGLAGLGLGAIPVGRPSGVDPTGDSVEVFVVSNGYHAGLVLPLRAHGVDWTERLRPEHFAAAADADHAAFGWGDREFYMETRTLADVRLGTAFRALFAGSGTVIHAALWPKPEPGSAVRRILATPGQYAALAGFVRDTFADAVPEPYPGRSYGANDAFYRAAGTFSPIDTCNEWVSRGLRAAGLRTGLWTPFAQSVLWHRD